MNTKKFFNLKVILSLVTVLTVLGCSKSTEPNVTKQDLPKISVQLWSVKNALTNDFKGTLQKLSDMGFEGVEFAGNFGPYAGDAKGLKQFLNSLNLTASGAHVNYDALSNANIDSTLDFYQTLGAKLLIVPWDERAWHPTDVKEMVAQLNAIQVKVTERNMVFGYHNHDQEFNEFQGETYWDYIAQNTNNSFLLQLDVGWVNYSKKDAVNFVTKYPNRTLTTHYKVRTKDGQPESVILGDDGYDWATLIKTNMAVGGTKWIVVEQEEYPAGLTELDSVKLSKQGLDKIMARLD
ncbi:sugar phosphate isomerase/epimerase family protein [Psychrosphaera algicola]|uniref:Sugar phosphate isomerase/epimerase n=1 Tax=Psychrosphaera algicola TaxID=3023714 RepID=A0ABT5FA11_9GAMM|nr:sugar phosphate isomerase/epimerase [Psychrosphaera sp. G1-22]MDC2888359.1 sugar phosphate isomerase/epimerase [Psychrosphaera sp. G1-22]